MNLDEREAALKKFKSDPAVTVLLMSLKCGALGLNLTYANHVILFDIWWNPVDRISTHLPYSFF